MKSSVVAVVLSFLCSQTWAQFQSQAQQQSSQYPRIKIGGPLGQLIPNGIQLGAGLGSLMNQLIGQAESAQQQQQQQSSAPVSPYAALRPQMPSFGGLSSQSSPMTSYSTPLGSYSPQKGFQFNSQLIPQNFYSEGLFGSASSPVGLSSGRQQSFTGHSSLGLGSTNSELFSPLSSALFD